VIAAAPEDLDTLKEIADKLAGNDDLHTALNQAITEKADASALANEVSRATGAENDLRTAIGTKADATAATKESLGVVKVGDGLNVTDGTISVDTTVLPAVPTNVSQLTNDSNFITAADADSRYALSATADSLSVGLSKK
jgi:hypothetical protein